MTEEHKQKLRDAQKKRRANEAKGKEVKGESLKIDKSIRIFKKNFAARYVIGQTVPQSLMERLPELEKRGIV